VIAADGPMPLVFSGWRVHLTSMYDGTLTKGDQTRTACACRNESNVVVGDQSAEVGNQKSEAAVSLPI